MNSNNFTKNYIYQVLKFMWPPLLLLAILNVASPGKKVPHLWSRGGLPYTPQPIHAHNLKQITNYLATVGIVALRYKLFIRIGY